MAEPRLPTASRLTTIAVLLALLLLGPRAVTFYTDWLWFVEVGHQRVFLRMLETKLAIGALAGALAFGLLAGFLRVALRALRRRDFAIATAEGTRIVTLEPASLRPLVYGAAAAAALLLALIASSRWEQALFFLYGVPFGRVDPILGYDVGFYLFTLPFLRFLQRFGLIVLILALAGVLGMHVAAGNLGHDPRRGLYASRAATHQFSVLTIGVFLLLGFGAWLAIPALLTDGARAGHGATYVDIHARLPALRVLMVASVAGAALAAYQFTIGRFWPVATAAALYVGVSLAGSAFAAVVQRFVVAPNEQVRETPYIVHNVRATRDAFALDTVEERELSGDASLTREDIDNNAATLGNVPLWDHRPLLDTFGQIQEIRTYYDFVSVDNDRYWINGEYRQIMLSVRELNSESLPSGTWVNERLTYTHGYGLTLGPVNQVTEEGLPVLFIQDLPLTSSVDLVVDQPSIYFGELSNDHVFVKTATPEFHYPKGNDNVHHEYQGEGGVSLDNALRRLMFAIRFRSTDVLFSPNLSSDSRVLMYRRIGDRVRRIAPFLTYDPDPYLAISDGALIWIRDAYTTSQTYPYAAAFGGDINYIRASVKVAIDAYHGGVTFYRVDAADPIAATLARIFPDLLRPLEEMPEDLRTRMRYPRAIFGLQAAVFATYHMTNPAVFYGKEDQWDVPLIADGGSATHMEPYYTIMKLPGEREAEYIQMLPFTPRQKDNLAAWLVARNDGEHYGRLRAFTFPKQTVIFGPRQVIARVNQDQVIAPQITLWNQQGSEVIQGTLLVIPIEESLIYIRPLYLRSSGGKIPELKRVVVAYRNQIVMEETLEQGLERLFPSGREGRRAQAPAAGRTTAGGPAAPGGAPPGLPALARRHYQDALEAQRAGDWARYGAELEALGRVLERMAEE
jgi:hypothetical protein